MSECFLRSTIIIGDSNTLNLKFGQGKGTFGQLIPGRRQEATFIHDINPLDCCGYKNVIIHCGINDIKHYTINDRDKVEECFVEFRNKLSQIMTLCPNAKIVVSPILPTKRHDLNARGMHFNRCLFDFENCSENRFSTLKFSVFRDPTTGCLGNRLGRYWNPEDALHLGSNGIRILVQLMRDQIYSSTVSSNKTYKAALTGPNASGGGWIVMLHGLTS